MTTKDKDIELLKKWFGLELQHEIGSMRFYFPYVNFQYKWSLTKEELKKFCENEYFDLIFADGDFKKHLDLQFKIPAQYEEELKKYKDFTEILIGRSGVWPFDK